MFKRIKILHVTGQVQLTVLLPEDLHILYYSQATARAQPRVMIRLLFRIALPHET